MLCRPALFAAAFALSACASPPVEPVVEPVAEAAAPAPDCAPPSSFGGFVFWMDDPSVRAGSDVRLTPWYTPQPGVLEPVPAGCLRVQEVTGPARLLEDGRTVRISEEAGEGQHVLVRGEVGEAGISGRIVVYRPDLLPLVGYWKQRSEDCAGTEPMRELVFNGDHTFSATWMPFEVYKDFWGTYAFDAETRELVLTPTGGNHIPGDARLSGTVSLDDGAFSPGAGFFGSPAAGAPCDAPFRR